MAEQSRSQPADEHLNVDFVRRFQIDHAQEVPIEAFVLGRRWPVSQAKPMIRDRKALQC